MFKPLLNNKGSSVIMVLIAMAFISILGTILMFMAFTGFQIKAAEAKGERAFYSAETALDEVRAGIQQIVSNCIAEAYTDMLRDYAHQVNLENIFRGNFEASFIAHDLVDGDAISDVLNYNIAVLESFVNVTENVTISSESGEIIWCADYFTLRGVEIRHRTFDGFVSGVVSDIVVVIPDFSYVRADYPINEIALIATRELTVPATSVSLNDGIAYAGLINVDTGEHGTFTVNNSTLIVGGHTIPNDGVISVNGNFVVNGNSSLWARRIDVGENNSSAELRGEAYIADDLVLNGAGAKAILAGHYYGFGNALVADRSSSIIVNGFNSHLDMSALSTLFLAGHSFINTEGSVDVLMGQSVSVKSDQLAYLVPASAIEPHRMNPIIFTGSTPEWSLNSTAVFSAAQVEPVIRFIPDTGQWLLFLFRRFEDSVNQTAREAANEYFKEYFEDNKEDIRDYIEQYLDYYRPPQNAQTSGNYYNLTGGEIDIPASLDTANLTNVSGRLQQMYDNITRSLSTSVPLGDSVTPYAHIVRVSAVNALSDGEYDFLDTDGNVRAKIIRCNGSSETSVSNSDSFNLIISTGNVSVGPSGFNGLIISNGTVTLNGSVTATPSEIIPSIRAEYDGRRFGEFLNQTITDDEFETSNPTWDMSALVFYENWHKR